MRPPDTAGHERAAAPRGFSWRACVAEWESPGQFQAAVTTPEFGEMTKQGPPSFPSLYEVVRTVDAGSA